MSEKIEALRIDGAAARLELGRRTCGAKYDLQPWKLSLYGDWGDVARDLDNDDIRAIRDWCNEALKEGG